MFTRWIETLEQFVLQPAAALGVAGISGQILQKALHQRRERGVELRGPQADPPMHRLIHRNCDGLRGLTGMKPAALGSGH